MVPALDIIIACLTGKYSVATILSHKICDLNILLCILTEYCYYVTIYKVFTSLQAHPFLLTRDERINGFSHINGLKEIKYRSLRDNSNGTVISRSNLYNRLYK